MLGMVIREPWFVPSGTRCNGVRHGSRFVGRQVRRAWLLYFGQSGGCEQKLVAMHTWLTTGRCREETVTTAGVLETRESW